MPKRPKQPSDDKLPPRPAGFAAYMRAMAQKGGRIGGARRMETMTPKQRQAVARKAAHARWNKIPSEEA